MIKDLGDELDDDDLSQYYRVARDSKIVHNKAKLLLSKIRKIAGSLWARIYLVWQMPYQSTLTIQRSGYKKSKNLKINYNVFKAEAFKHGLKPLTRNHKF